MAGTFEGFDASRNSYALGDMLGKGAGMIGDAMGVTPGAQARARNDALFSNAFGAPPQAAPQAVQGDPSGQAGLPAPGGSTPHAQPQGQPQAQPQSYSDGINISNRDLIAVMRDRYSSDEDRTIAQSIYKTRTTPEETLKLRQGERAFRGGKEIAYNPAAPREGAGPRWGVVGTDAYGNPQYGQIVNGAPVGGPPAPAAPPAGLEDMPAGADPKEWRKLSTQRAAREADAEAAGLQRGSDAWNNYMLKKPPTQQKPLTEGQAKAQGFATRMENANKTLGEEGAIAEGTSRTNQALDLIPGGFGAGKKSPLAQRVEQAQRSFINAQLRKESGAVISPDEFESARRQYFPVPGDGPEVIAQKAQERAIAIDNMQREGSNAPGSAASEQPRVFDAGDGVTIELLPE